MNYWKILFNAEEITKEMKDKYVGKIINIDHLHAFLEAHPLWDYPMGLEVQWDGYGYILDIRISLDKDLLLI